MAKRRLSSRERKILIAIAIGERCAWADGVDGLVKRGLVRQSGAVYSAEGSWKIYGLTERGYKVVAQLQDVRLRPRDPTKVIS